MEVKPGNSRRSLDKPGLEIGFQESRRPGRSTLLKLRYLGEVKLVHFHRRNHHVKRLFTAGSDRGAHRFHIRQHVDQTLVEAEIPDSALHPSILHVKGSVPSHSGKHFFEGFDFADVPQPRHQYTAFGRRNHLLDGPWIAHGSEDYV